MHQKEAIDALIATVLDGTELRLKVDSYTLDENLKSGQVRIHAAVHDLRTGEKHKIEGQGVGIVDAFFTGLVGKYAQTFPSLHTIRFADFSIKAKLDTGRLSARSDSTAEVVLHVANSDGREVVFVDTSPSITRSSINVVLGAVEFFINCERAFSTVYRALEHARRENRVDSVASYTQQLATLVETTSYSQVIEQLHKR